MGLFCFDVHAAQVIPVTQETGLIEWVLNTTPVKQVLEDEWTARLDTGARALRVNLSPGGNTKAGKCAAAPPPRHARTHTRPAAHHVVLCCLVHVPATEPSG